MGKEETVTLFQRDSMPVTRLAGLKGALHVDKDGPRVFIVGRESCRMGGFGDCAIEDLFQGIYSVASGRVFSVHEMHGCCENGRLVVAIM